MQTRIAKVIFAGTILLFIVVYSGCGNEGPVEEPIKAEVVFNIQLPKLAPFGAISTITVVVTAGPNDNTVLATAPLTIQDNTATGKVSVLAGKNRVFTLEAKDEDNVLSGSGTAMADVVAGETITVDISIQFITGDVIVNGHWEEPQNNHKKPAEIIPGEEVAGIKLLEPFSKAKKLYGKPVIPPGFPNFFVYEKNGLLGAVLDLNENKAIEYNEPIIIMSVMEPYDGKTASGNGIGSTRADVEREFGVTDDIEPDKENDMERHKYTKKGIDVTYDVKTRSVVSITIYPVLEAAPQKVDSKVFKQGVKLLKRRYKNNKL